MARPRKRPRRSRIGIRVWKLLVLVACSAPTLAWGQSAALEPNDLWRPWEPSRLGAERSAGDWKQPAEGALHVRMTRAVESDAPGELELPPGFFEARAADQWEWQLMPAGIMYRAYLAGVKESRMFSGFSWFDSGDSFWQSTVGGRLPIVRYGTVDSISPVGFQVDAEGAAILRLDVRNNIDLAAVDFRGGVVASFGDGRTATKLAYYHMSSHVGDEFLIANPGFNRLNWSRDTLVIGRSHMLTESLRIYGEIGWAFYTDVSEPWEFQFGVEYAPFRPTGPHGAPYFAANAHLRQEVDFGGSFTVQTGWAWRSRFQGSLLRVGFEYYNGKSSQYSFYNMFEQQFTIGLWYDY